MSSLLIAMSTLTQYRRLQIPLITRSRSCLTHMHDLTDWANYKENVSEQRNRYSNFKKIQCFKDLCSGELSRDHALGIPIQRGIWWAPVL